MERLGPRQLWLPAHCDNDQLVVRCKLILLFVKQSVSWILIYFFLLLFINELKNLFNYAKLFFFRYLLYQRASSLLRFLFMFSRLCHPSNRNPQLTWWFDTFNPTSCIFFNILLLFSNCLNLLYTYTFFIHLKTCYLNYWYLTSDISNSGYHWICGPERVLLLLPILMYVFGQNLTSLKLSLRFTCIMFLWFFIRM